MPTLWAQTSKYDTISVGDELPILVKFEFRMPVKTEPEAPTNAPSDSSPKFPGENPVSPEKLTAYVKELLLKGFPADSVNNENTIIKAEILTEFLPGDTVSLCGKVVGKSDQGDLRTVECQVTVESHDGAILANASAVVSL